MSTERPWLMLDVDGVLNVLGYRPHEAPEGKRGAVCNGYWIVFDPGNAERLAHLAEHYELAWATTWEHLANEWIGPLFGLPTLPVCEFAALRKGHTEIVAVSPTWKLPDVRRFVGDRPCLWLDDDIHQDAREWAFRRSVPTGVLCVEPTVGLDEVLYRAALDFALSLEAAA